MLSIRSDGSSTMHQQNLAYLDSSTASLLLQMAAGALAAAAVTLKIFWRRILRVLHIRREEDIRPSSGPEQ
jgi:hypothetical protein